MGSFCKPSKVTSTSSSSTSALPEYAAAYKSLIPQYQQVGATAYDPATEQSVAGFSAPQMQAFQGVQNNQGVYQPYLGAAAGLTAAGAGPAAGGIGAYINPFTQNVVNAALDDWQEQSGRTMQQVNSNAASIGALTGDRSQVAQQLAREAGDRAMSSNIANLYQQGFNTALGAAQNDQNRYLAAGQQFAGLGGMAQQYGYQDVNALLGVGGMQQAQTQAELDAATANAQQRQQYPMYMLDWMRGGLTGLGSAAGQKQTGTQTQPGPSMFQQVAGLGLSAAGLYNNWGKKDGGRIQSEGGMSKLLSDVGMAADGLSNIRRKCGGRVGYADGGEVEDETSPFSYYNQYPTQTGVAVKPRPPAISAPPVQSKEIGPWGTSVVPAGMSKLGASDVVPANDGLGNLGLSSDAGTALMAAGFGMMSSTSPHALAAAGEGGLAGLQMYNALADRRKREAMIKAKEAEGKTFEMGGRLVRALPDGTVQEIYTAPEKPMDPLERRMKLAQIAKLEREGVEGSAPNEMFSTVVQYEKQADGSERPFQLGNRGGKKYLDVPEGAQIMGPEEISAARSRGRIAGQHSGEARRDLPQALMTASETVKVIDETLADPSLDSIVGPIQGVTPNVTPGARNAQARINQLTGRAFLQAFQSLRGGGQITEIEGKKATEAITRLGEQGVDEKDYRQALQDLRNIARNGAIMAQYQAGFLTAEEALPQIVDFDGLGIKRFYQKSGTPTAAPQSGADLVWNPATGDLEPSQ